ncbi:hypothetical protein E4U54_006221 [Claviceps lovelessii]|nr:hypothetical protein E4U54_006221 [Claviceps lovelessii]
MTTTTQELPTIDALVCSVGGRGLFSGIMPDVDEHGMQHTTGPLAQFRLPARDHRPASHHEPGHQSRRTQKPQPEYPIQPPQSVELPLGQFKPLPFSYSYTLRSHIDPNPSSSTLGVTHQQRHLAMCALAPTSHDAAPAPAPEQASRSRRTVRRSFGVTGETAESGSSILGRMAAAMANLGTASWLS